MNTARYISFVANEPESIADIQLGTDQDTVHSMMRATWKHELGNDYSVLEAMSWLMRVFLWLMEPIGYDPEAIAIASKSGNLPESTSPTMGWGCRNSRSMQHC